MDYIAMGKRIQQSRKKYGWTQKKVAEDIGISTSFLGHAERGSRKISLETALKLCEALNLPLDVMVGSKFADLFVEAEE